MSPAPKLIGSDTKYIGTEHAYLAGYAVRIVAVMKNALVSDEHEYLTTDAEIASAGGVTADDRIEIAPIMRGGRVSFASSDARATDLDCFRELNPMPKA
jgi:hypothetical protein